jgi:formylglycine-generating enzyme required for sulfatase activity
LDSTGSDVFLSHSSADKAIVEEIARKLLGSGITPWLDIWNLVPGEPWQEAIEKALENCSSCAVFIGVGGSGPWQNEEMRAALDRRVRDSRGKFRVIPVYLPGTHSNGEYNLSSFLKRQTWVQFERSTDEEETFRRLVCGIQGKAPGPSGVRIHPSGECPYRGLHAFDVSDDRYFFGRDAIRGRLLNRLSPLIGPRQEIRLIGILGPSGSGKSSLARAGLVAALRKGEIDGSSAWPIAILRPGANPLESLAVCLSSQGQTSGVSALRTAIRELSEDESTLHLMTRLMLSSAKPDSRFLLVVDQFEEIFALCPNEVDRTAFVENLLYAASVVGGQIFVVLVMRADFYGRCAAYSSLAAALSASQVLVDVMTKKDLRLAIEEPARLTGYSFEPGLVDVILKDAINEPGVLPLLQNALFQLWERRQGSLLTHAAYETIGGLGGAIERQAEGVFNQLDPEEKRLCRKVLLRLVQPGDGTATKRRTPLREFESEEVQHSGIEHILSKLTAADTRLLVSHGEEGSVSGPTIELAHEAIITNWRRLRDWIEEDRQGIVIRRRITDAAAEWRSAAFNDALLFRGPRLTESLAWADSHKDDLNEQEHEFLQRSADHAVEQARMGDAASLDQLEAVAPRIWLRVPDMGVWLERARKLTDGIGRYRKQLEKLDNDSLTRPDADRRFRVDILRTLIVRLERFRDGLVEPATHIVMVLPQLETFTVDHLSREWECAIESIADVPECPAYRGLRITPQSGLVPLGRDPRSGLWEFAHLISGTPPARSADGKLQLSDLSSIVLVLLPGGSFRMGAVKPSSEAGLGAPNVDPHALDDEGPVHTVTLAPYFLSKFQMTQGQWLTCAGTNPSMFRPEKSGGITLLHPVECVGWPECQDLLTGVGLALPTEAQWEYGARANTTSIWWSGNDPEAIRAASNLNTSAPTPVGHYDRPNAFGLHDVAGNVWEWCRERCGSYLDPVIGDNGERTPSNSTMLMARGGSFFNDPSFARSSIRYFKTVPDARFNNRGLRPARPLLAGGTK